MKFVNVGTLRTDGCYDLNPAIIQPDGLALMSLIDGFRQVDFNTHTLAEVLERIQKYKELYIDPVSGRLFIDSGGYSIIVGDVHPSAVYRLVQCFNVVLAMPEFFDRIFSLDIPWSKMFDFMNTKKTVCEFNEYSLSTAREILMKNEETRRKFYFVWHFKMPRQYAVWQHLYEELQFNTLIQNRAIGGLVGLRGITQINFSPFVGIAYRCFLDFLDANDFTHDFTLHYLGCYLKQDRFVMAVLDDLFRRYLEDEVQVRTTYDSINFSHSARMNKAMPLFHIEEAGLVSYPSLIDAPQHILKTVYGENQTLRVVQSEIERRRNLQHLEDASSFAPLNTFSNRQLDLYFEMAVQEYGLGEIFFRFKSLTVINHHVKLAMDTLQRAHPSVFTDHVRKSIFQSMEHIYRFHCWFMDSRSRANLETIMGEFINAIGFPGDLS